MSDSTQTLPPREARSDEWWLDASLGLATQGVDDCLERLGEAVRALTDPPNPKAALAATLGAHTAALETRQALGGVRSFWVKILPRLARHPVAAGGSAVAVGLVLVAWLCWPAAVGAGASKRPEPESAEVRAVKLIEAREYQRAKRLIDAELPTPRGWYLHGEILVGQGDERAARTFFEWAADAGDELARHRLTVKALTPSRCKE